MKYTMANKINLIVVWTLKSTLFSQFNFSLAAFQNSPKHD